MIRYKLQNVPNKVNTGHTVLYGRVGTCTCISLVLNIPVKFQRIVFSSYYKRMAAMTYVLVHVLQNLHENSTKIIQRFSFLLYRLIVQVCNYQYGTALKYWFSITKGTGNKIVNSKKEIRRKKFLPRQN